MILENRGLNISSRFVAFIANKWSFGTNVHDVLRGPGTVEVVRLDRRDGCESMIGVMAISSLKSHDDGGCGGRLV